jgi:hypothetical protein
MTGHPAALRYWHGGIPGLPAGGSILPPSVTGRTDSARSICAAHGLDGGHVRDDRVFLATRLEIAELFAAMYPARLGGWVYEVDPVGPLERDPDYQGPSGESVQAPEARIIRVVGPLSREYVAMVLRVMTGGEL